MRTASVEQVCEGERRTRSQRRDYTGRDTHGSRWFSLLASCAGFLVLAEAGMAQAPSFSWAKKAGGGDSDSAFGVAVDGIGRVYVTGSFRTSADFGGGMVTSANGAVMPFIAKYDSAGNLIWVRSPTSSSQSDYGVGKGIAVDSAGDIVIVGSFQGGLVVGPYTIQNTTGYSAPFVAKYRADGTPLWAASAIRSTSCCSDDATAVAVDLNANVYIAGGFDGPATFGGISLTAMSADAFYAKYDSNGAVVWAKKLGGAGNDRATSICLDATGNFYLLGGFSGTVNFGGTVLSSPGGGVFVLKGLSDGSISWVKQMNGYPEETAGGIALDGLGNVYATAGPSQYVVKYDAGGNFLWNRIVGGNPKKLACDSVGNVSVCGVFTGAVTIGTTTLTSAGQYDVFIAQYDTAGNFRWAKRAGRFFDDIPGGIAADSAGNLLVAGSFYDSASFDSFVLTGNGDDIFVAKLGASTVPLYPILQSQPQNQSVSPGATATFGVMASGAPPLRFQWRFNGTFVAGGTNALLSVTNALLANAGSYDVIVTNAAGSVTSVVATLTVVPGTPSFGDNFADRGILIGFTNIVTGNNSAYTEEPGEPAHADRKGAHSAWLTWTAPDNGTCVLDTLGSSFDTTLAVYTGTVSSNLTLIVANDDVAPGTLQSRVAFSAAAGVAYQIAVDGYGITDVGNIVFHLSFSNSAPIITVQPQSRSVLAGSNTTFSVNALGLPTLTYQWRVNGTNLAGATGASYTINNVQGTNAGGYSVAVANSFGSITSMVATLTVLFRPAITASPQNLTVTSGGAAMFSVNASGTLPLSYQWRFNGSDISGAFATGLALYNTQPAQAGGYSVVVSNPYGAITSAVATLTVNFSLTVLVNGSGSVLRAPNLANYSQNSMVNLTATPDPGAFFVNWSGDAGGAGNPLVVTMTSNKVITANFAATSLTLAIQGLGSVAKSPDRAYYSLGEQVTLNALPGRWHVFGSWSDGAVANPRVIAIGSSNSYTAIFTPTQAVETLTFGGVSRIAPVGTPAVFVDGEFVVTNVLTRTGAVQVALLTTFPNGTIFYTLDGTVPSFLSRIYGGPFPLARSAIIRAAAFDAIFVQSWEADPVELGIIPEYRLAILNRGGGTVELEPAGDLFARNTVVSLSATPLAGWSFLQWLGHVTGTNTSASVVMYRERRVEAVFGTTLMNAVSGAGTVVVEPGAGLYPYGTMLRLTALPQPGQSFAVWGGAAGGTNNPLTFMVTNANPVVSAAFAPLSAGQADLSLVAAGGGRVATTPRANRYAMGTVVMLTAIPDPGQEFLGWSGDANGVDNPLMLVLNTSKVIGAEFTKRPRLTAVACGEPATGMFALQLSGEFGGVYWIERTVDLRQWNTLASVTNVFGTVQINDSGGLGQRFYRARLASP